MPKLSNSHEVVDVVMYNNEIEILELRIKYLEKYVNKFIVAESQLTFSNNKKTLADQNLLKTKLGSNFKKIDFVTLPKYNSENFWENERNSRAFIFRYARLNYPQTAIIFSDVDEIPSKQQVLSIPLIKPGIYSIPMKMTYFYVNTRTSGDQDVWTRAKILSPGFINEYHGDGTKIREEIYPNLPNLELGCHFSYFNFSIKNLQTKYKSFSHNEFDFAGSSDSKLIFLSNKYSVSHLGDFYKKGRGILNVEKDIDLNHLQKFVIANEPNVFIDFKKVPMKIMRLYYSFLLTERMNSKEISEFIIKFKIRKFSKMLQILIKHSIYVILKKLL